MYKYKPLETMRKRLIELILKRSFKFSKRPSFRLASGQMSNFYFNCKPTTLDSEGMYLIGNLLYKLIKNQASWKKAQAVGGLTLGADPVANAIAYTSYIESQKSPASLCGAGRAKVKSQKLKVTPLKAFVVRKEPKKHGTMLWIEGEVKRGDKVLIVEDVITTGSSSKKAVERARECGLKVVGVLALIDRQEGGGEAIERMGLPFKALLTKDEIFNAYRSLPHKRGSRASLSPSPTRL